LRYRFRLIKIEGEWKTNFQLKTTYDLRNFTNTEDNGWWVLLQNV